jgi:hypothetical protein
MANVVNSISISAPEIVINNTFTAPSPTQVHSFIPIVAEPVSRPSTPIPPIIHTPKAVRVKHLEKESPQWGELNKVEDSHTLRKAKLDLDIKDLVNKIMKCVRIQSGDITAIPSLINDLHIHIDAFYSSENSEDMIFKKISESSDIEFIKIELKKKKITSYWGKCFKGNSETIEYKSCKVKPLNKPAEDICYAYMNKEVHKIFETL